MSARNTGKRRPVTSSTCLKDTVPSGCGSIWNSRVPALTAGSQIRVRKAARDRRPGGGREQQVVVADLVLLDVFGVGVEPGLPDPEGAGFVVHRLHVDVNVGDPIWPEPEVVLLPGLRGGEGIELVGYPLHGVHAEKLVTAVQCGTPNTRWRDFADVWTLSNRHPVAGSDLQSAVERVAHYRRAQLIPLRVVLDGYAGIGQAKWRRGAGATTTSICPSRLPRPLTAVIAFADPVLAGEVGEQSWNPKARVWR